MRRCATKALLGAAALALGACGPVAPAGRSPGAAAAAGATAASSGGTGSPPFVAASTPTAADFRAGDGKTAAERLADPRYAGSDLRRGELLSLACQACHTLEAGAPDNIGPNLAGIFGRRAAARPQFMYSEALRGSGIVWTPAAVEAWLADPAGFLPGNLMPFAGYRSAEDRRDLVAFLLRATAAEAR